MFQRICRALALLLLTLQQPVAAQSTGVREITVSDRSVVPVATRLRISTLLVLPDGDDILDVDCGDKDFWVVEATQNIVRIKPAKEGAVTNVNVRTTAGRIYSFAVTEGKAPPDYKVFVVSDPSVPREAPRFYSAAQYDLLQRELASALDMLKHQREQVEESAKVYRRQYPSLLRFDYGTTPYASPFFVRAIWHDGQFTYLRSDARELPALYEVLDGRGSLVNFQVRDGGIYVVPKVLDRGYLALGKKRWTFERR